MFSGAGSQRDEAVEYCRESVPEPLRKPGDDDLEIHRAARSDDRRSTRHVAVPSRLVREREPGRLPKAGRVQQQPRAHPSGPGAPALAARVQRFHRSAADAARPGEPMTAMIAMAAPTMKLHEREPALVVRRPGTVGRVDAVFAHATVHRRSAASGRQNGPAPLVRLYAYCTGRRSGARLTVAVRMTPRGHAVGIVNANAATRVGEVHVQQVGTSVYEC